MLLLSIQCLSLAEELLGVPTRDASQAPIAHPWFCAVLLDNCPFLSLNFSLFFPLPPPSDTATNKNSPGAISKEDLASKIPQDSRQPPAPIDPSIAKWFYISSASS